ncbi:MAG: DUF2231 domain-containing protein [Ignavibacteriae bacterium]|nr:DUF2231 domain-containing protein [Ignavibacteriota bacterium]
MEFLADKHPLVIHFPIAFLIFYTFMEILSQFLKNDLSKKITYLFLLFGVWGGIAAVLTGNMEFQLITQNKTISENIIYEISEHEFYATLTMWFFFILLIVKTYLILKKKNQSKFSFLFIIFAVIGFYLIYNTSKIGGRLVYEFGIGTNLIN